MRAGSPSHGGAWRRGDKEHDTGYWKAAHFPQRGFALASINYRLVPGATVEQQAEDAAAALRAIVDRAGELGVAPEQVEEYARAARASGMDLPPPRLYSPEEAAEYLGIHVQTVRAWIRSGRLKASRLAGQRALRIKSSDLMTVLEPVDAGDQQP